MKTQGSNSVVSCHGQVGDVHVNTSAWLLQLQMMAPGDDWEPPPDISSPTDMFHSSLFGLILIQSLLMGLSSTTRQDAVSSIMEKSTFMAMLDLLLKIQVCS